MLNRRKTVTVQVGKIAVGGNAPIAVQSMTNTDTGDVEGTVKQIKQLADAGAELVRVTVNNEDAARAVPRIKEKLMVQGYDVPLVGDFHFNGHLLLTKFAACAEALDKYRINPGTVGSGKLYDKNFTAMIEVAIRSSKPVRISANWGSVDRDLLTKNMEKNACRKQPDAENAVLVRTLVESVTASAFKARELGMAKDKIIVGVKTSDLATVIEANRLLAQRCDYPIHLGLTEAGGGNSGIVKSAAACAILLNEGIGDTIRVSLTPLPGGARAEEVEVAKLILQSVGARAFAPVVTSCPGCGRTENDRYQSLALRVKKYVGERLQEWKKTYANVESLKIAVMGCVVNGPGEASHADVAISLPGRSEKPVAIVFAGGKPLKTLHGANIEDDFLKILEKYVQTLPHIS